jgi:hypothetical protein
MDSIGNSTLIAASGFIETATTRLIKYIFFQILQIPALLCLIFIFYCVYREHQLRSLNNHAMLIILFSCFLLLTCEQPVTLTFFRRGSLEIQSDHLCLYWIFINYSIQGITTVMMAFASIERFVLIFYWNFITGSQHRKLWFHYIPMLFCCTSVLIWYIVLIFIYPCENMFDYTMFLCNSACYQSNVLIGILDWMGTVLLPVVIVILFSLLLLIRAILQKRRLHLPLNWRRTRKMIIQLLAVVFVFLCTQVPLSIFAIVRLAFIPDFLTDILTLWYYYTPYFIFSLTPFAYVITTKEVLKYLIKLKPCKPRRVNDLTINTVRRIRNADTVL